MDSSAWVTSAKAVDVWASGVGVTASPADDDGDACVLSAAGGEAFGFGKPGIFGTAMAVRVSFRWCVCVGVVFGGDSGACAGVAGVDTCVKSLSEGA